MKKREKENRISYFPEQIPACEFRDGHFWVPPEWEDYYVRIWAWRLNRLNALDSHKLKYLHEYEKTNGKITQWRDSTGALTPL